MAETDTNTPIISQLSIADEKPYIEFLQKAYKDQFHRYRFESFDATREFWRWEYMSNPVAIPGKPLVWVCKIGGKIVGQLCVMPVPVKIGGRDYIGGWYHDFIVLREFRDRKIGRKLICETAKGVRDSIDISMAVIVTERSRALFRMHGLREVGTLKKNVSVAGLTDILLSIKRPKTARAIEIQEVTALDADFDSLWKDTANRFDCLIKRDSQVLRWRFKPQLYWSYRLFLAKEGGAPKGYIVVKIGAQERRKRQGLNIGVVSDLFFDPSQKHVGYALLEKALSVLKTEASVIRCDVMHEQIERFLRSVGFFSIKSDNLLFLSFSERVKKEDVVLAKEEKSWFLTYGDSDLDFS